MELGSRSSVTFQRSVVSWTNHLDIAASVRGSLLVLLQEVLELSSSVAYDREKRRFSGLTSPLSSTSPVFPLRSHRCSRR
jgi:hypothetical protein